MENYRINNATSVDCAVKDCGDIGSSPGYFIPGNYTFIQVFTAKCDYNFTPVAIGNIFSLRDLMNNIDKVTSFLELPVNWNENGAGQFSQNLIDKTINILHRLNYQPEIFPTGSNSIILEYNKSDGRYLGIEVSENQNIIFTAPKEEIGIVDPQDIQELCKIVNELNDL